MLPVLPKGVNYDAMKSLREMVRVFREMHALAATDVPVTLRLDVGDKL